jgi:hypothetical protein
MTTSRGRDGGARGRRRGGGRDRRCGGRARARRTVWKVEAGAAAGVERLCGGGVVKVKMKSRAG